MAFTLPHPVPPFYFPTRVLHVDDQDAYLRAIRPHLEPDVQLESFASAEDALDELASSLRSPSAISAVIHRERNADTAQSLLAVNVGMIHEIMYDETRFLIPSVVIADYAMPEMSGLDMLRSSPNPDVGRILLTGQADQATVIKAFNEFAIDAYVEKSDPDAVEKLARTIATLQRRYFSIAFSAVSLALFGDDFRMLRDEAAMKHLAGMLSITPVEMYLHDSPKGLLFLDADANAEFVLVVGNAELMGILEKAEEAGIPEADLAAIGEERAIPVFEVGETGFLTDGNVNYELVDVEPVRGTFGSYYMALLPDLCRFKLSAVVSYNRWLDERDDRSTVDPALR